MKLVAGLILIGFGMLQHHTCNLTNKKSGIHFAPQKPNDSSVVLGGPVRKLIFNQDEKQTAQI